MITEFTYTARPANGWSAADKQEAQKFRFLTKVPRDIDDRADLVESYFPGSVIAPVRQEWHTRLSPEQRLCLAILDDALGMVFGPKRVKFRESANERSADWKRTVEWLHSDDHRAPFNVTLCCHALGIDVDALRARFPTFRALGYSSLRAHSRGRSRLGVRRQSPPLSPA